MKKKRNSDFFLPTTHSGLNSIICCNIRLKRFPCDLITENHIGAIIIIIHFSKYVYSMLLHFDYRVKILCVSMYLFIFMAYRMCFGSNKCNISSLEIFTNAIFLFFHDKICLHNVMLHYYKRKRLTVFVGINTDFDPIKYTSNGLI